MNACRCPACGAKLQIVANDDERHTKRSVFHSDAPQFFESSVAPSYPQRRETQQQQNIPPGTHKDVTHWRPETPVDIKTFALKSAGCGIAAGLLSILPILITNALMNALAKSNWLVWCPPLNRLVAAIHIPWHCPFWIAITALGASWFVISGKAQGLITFTEILTRLDLDGDGKIGTVPKQERTVEVILKEGSGRHRDQRAKFTDDPKFHNLAMKILNGAHATETTAKECGISRGRWIKIRDELVDRGCAAWKDPANHNLGIDILAAGRAALRAALPRPDDS